MPSIDQALACCGSASQYKSLIWSGCTIFIVSFTVSNLQAESHDFKQFAGEYCLDCHSGAGAESNLDLETIGDQPIEDAYSEWRRILSSLQNGAMPPDDAEQPSALAVQSAVRAIERSINTATQKAAKDPGPQTLRRITNAEYEYCVEDLTGLQLNLGNLLVGDSVGSSGYTNSASGQFIQAETLKRYLEAAKLVAQHVMVGAGPLHFNAEPGLTGLELSAIRRIQALYRKYGYRAAAGEGAKPFGLEVFPTAFQLAWQYQHRKSLGIPEATIEELADEARISRNFAKHVWELLNRNNALYPLAEIQQSWERWPNPHAITGDRNAIIKGYADRLFSEIGDWQKKFAASASHEEEVALLVQGQVTVPSEVTFLARGTRKLLKLDGNFTPDLSNPKLYSEDGWIQWEIAVDAAEEDLLADAAVVFTEPMIRIDLFEGPEQEPVPLVECLTEEDLRHLGIQSENQRAKFVVPVGESKTVRFQLPQDCRYAELIVTARLDPQQNLNTIARCTIRDITNDNSDSDSRLAREYSSLLGDPASETMATWQAGLQEFASVLPQISHREPAPSDRDPIPELFDNTYNMPERNYFHTAVKYARDDRFLVERIANREQVEELDLAWADLLASFDYHDVNLRFAAEKFGVNLEGESIRTLNAPTLARFPPEVATELKRLRDERARIDAMLTSARAQHVSDLLGFAKRLWRKQLSSEDISQVSQFYDSALAEGLPHADAVRITLARILVSPQFLYRIEVGSASNAPTELSNRELTQTELANRLSFAIWSSMPDKQLADLAETGQLLQGDALDLQVRRMLSDRRSKRFAEQFFGQWLGFYRFDQFRGVDLQRFPEFDDALRNALYEEAICFFAHLVQQDRDYSEMLNADYTFLNEVSANHYGIKLPANDSPRHQLYAPPKAEVRKVTFTTGERGGVLAMGALLTATSAPLRTSPVKRGDWVLRRILGTPVPPPPADAGSLPADDVLADGLTVMERLDAHRSSAECMACHIRIDPLGFALEHYDSLGRWRDNYADGKPIYSSGTLADSTFISGVDGLREYLLAQQAQRRRHFSANLVAYFLGRAESVFDTQLIEEVSQTLSEDPRISSAVLTIVNSVQFRQIRNSQASEVVRNVQQ